MEREELNFYLQQASPEALIQLCREIEKDAAVEIIQKPTSQTLMVPIQDPITNGSFHGGEVLVTSSIVQVNGVSGWSMVIDDNKELAITVALLDGAFAADFEKARIIELANSGKQQHATNNQKLNEAVNKTKVSFDLL